jgi:hypothetical protein
MRFNLKLVESERQIEALIIQQLNAQLRSALKGAVPSITAKMKTAVKTAITQSPEYRSLVGGDLQAQLGVPNPTSAMDSIIDLWLSKIEVKVDAPRKTGRRIQGGFTISMIQEDWSDALASPAASYTTLKGQKIPWLAWLLIAGDKTIIADYEFTPEVPRGARSRTGGGVMRRDTRKRWRVPSQYSGISSNNFVTRALMEVQLEKIIQKEIESRFSGN